MQDSSEDDDAAWASSDGEVSSADDEAVRDSPTGPTGSGDYYSGRLVASQMPCVLLSGAIGCAHAHNTAVRAVCKSPSVQAFRQHSAGK